MENANRKVPCMNVTIPNDQKVYLGLTEDVWKKRCYNNTKSFRNEKYKKQHCTVKLHLGTKEKNLQHTSINMVY